MTLAPPRLAPIELELLDFLSYVYLQIGEPGKAAALLAVRQTIAPASARAGITLALARTRNAQPRKALRALSELAEQIPDVLADASYHLTRAQALSTAGQHDEAVIAMRAYVDLRPASSAAAGDTQQTSS